MTEAEWLKCRDPDTLLSQGGGWTLRKAVLLGVACCRRLTLLECHPGNVVAVGAAESWADGVLDIDERVKLQHASRVISHNALEACREDLDDLSPHNGNAAYYAAEASHFLLCIADPQVVATTLKLCRESVWFTEHMNQPPEKVAEEHYQSVLLRDIIGNPFRRITFSSSWRTDTAVALARQMYDSRDFGAMPILADALQDAGCEEPAILDHCRDATAPHVRGCWVVDLVLGKE